MANFYGQYTGFGSKGTRPPTLPAYQGDQNGYMHGGYFAGADNVIDKWSFASGTQHAGPVGVSTYDHYGSATASDRGNGYSYAFGTGGAIRKIVEKCAYASDGDAVARTNGLYSNLAYHAGHTTAAYGWTSGGQNPTTVNEITKFPFASDTEAEDLQDLATGQFMCAGGNSETTGYTAGGYSSTGVQKFSFSSTATASTPFDLTEAKAGSAGSNSTSNGYFAGGDIGASTSNVIDKYSFSSDGDAEAMLGTLSTTTNHMVAGASSTTNGYKMGGAGSSDAINNWSFDDDSTVTDSGNLTQGRNFAGGSQF